jgi:hypothetical protein
VRRVAAALFLLLLAPAPARAALDVSASVDPDEVTVGEPVTFTVMVSGDTGGMEGPELPDLPDFREAGSGTSTFFTVVNGQVTRRADYTFTLVPEQEGTLTIGPATVRQGGQTYRTEPVTVTVLPAGSRSRAQPAPRQAPFPGLAPFPGFGNLGGFGPALREGDVVISLRADPEDPYVGEQVILTFELDRAVDFAERPDYTPPPTPGFTAHDVEPPKGADHTVRMEQGRRRVTEYRKMVLFPLKAGSATVGPARLGFTVDPFSGGQRLVTDPVQIQVRPLPEAGRPDDFAGAVGAFELTAQADRADAAPGDAVTLTVKVTGSGNFEAISGVDLGATDGLEVYDPEVRDDLRYLPEGVRGSRTFRYVLVPKRAGEMTLGPVRLSVFDPATAKYRTLEAGPFPLKVQGAASAPAPARAGTGAGGEAPAAAPAPSARREGVLWAAAVFAVGLVLLLARLLRRRREAPVPEAEARPPGPPPEPGPALEAALAATSDEAFLRETDRALRAYLGGCWDLPPPRVDADAVGRHMADAPEGEREACVAALAALQAARFAPGGSALDRQALVEQVRRAIEAARTHAPARV